MLRRMIAPLGVVGLVVGLSTVGVLTEPLQADSSALFRLVVPMYQPDQAAAWAKAITVPEIQYLVTLPRTTVANRADSKAGIAAAAAAGKTVLGYQTTGYAPQASSLTQAELQSQVAAYFNDVPGLGGIFLDEVSSFSPPCATSAPFFQTFAQWYRATYPGKKLVLNAGSVLCSAFAGTADAYLIFENTRNAYLDSGQYAHKQVYADSAYNWLRDLPNDQVWMISYNTPETELTAMANDMSDTAGVLWLSPFSTVASAYAELPPQSYLDALTLRARKGAPANTGTATATTPATLATTPTTAAPLTNTQVVIATTTTTAAPTTTTAPPSSVVSTTLAPATTVAPTTTVAPATTTAPPASVPSTTIAPSGAPVGVDPVSPLEFKAVSVLRRGRPTAKVRLEATLAGTPLAKAPSISKVTFAKNGKKIKTSRRARTLTVRPTKKPARYVITITYTSGETITSEPLIVTK